MHEAGHLAAANVDNPATTIGLTSTSSSVRLLDSLIDHPAANNTTAAASSSFALFLQGNTKETLEHLLLIVLAYVVVCLAFYRAIFSRYGRNSKLLQRVRFPNVRRVLLVTAHPDDESMFFGPTILSLIRRKDCKIYLLCLSNGNFEQKGHLRRDELWKACRVLKIESENITLVHATHLLDDPHIVWNPETIAHQVVKEAHTLDIDAVITFDRDGISNHPNHCAIFYATASMLITGLLPKGNPFFSCFLWIILSIGIITFRTIVSYDILLAILNRDHILIDCKVFTLETTNLFRKYIFLFDLLFTRLMSNNWMVIGWREHRVLQKAMEQHRSQMVWFRRIYVRCSRYMFINSLRELSVSDAELELQLMDS